MFNFDRNFCLINVQSVRSWYYKQEKNANYASKNRMYIKRDNVRMTKIVLDLHDVIVDSKKVVLFEYE